MRAATFKKNYYTKLQDNIVPSLMSEQQPYWYWWWWWWWWWYVKI